MPIRFGTPAQRIKVVDASSCNLLLKLIGYYNINVHWATAKTSVRLIFPIHTSTNSENLVKILDICSDMPIFAVSSQKLHFVTS